MRTTAGSRPLPASQARSGSTPMPTRTWSHASRRPSVRVSCSTRSAPVAAATLAPRTTSTPSLRCRSANQVPTTGPSTAASGASAASTIVVCTPALARRGRDLLADEAGADDDQAPALGERGAQGAGVLERAQGVDVGEGVEQRQAARAAAGGDEQLLVADRVAVVERDDVPGAVEGRRASAEQQLDVAVGVPRLRAQAEAVLGLGAREDGLGERRAVVGRREARRTASGCGPRSRRGAGSPRSAGRPARRPR